MSKKILVLKGGFSAEREVSLVTGSGVSTALKNAGYNVVDYTLDDAYNFVATLKVEKPDVVFNALHGNFGEDGAVQGLLDMLQIPYTHSNIVASAMGMDKDISKKLAIENGVNIAKSSRLTFKEFITIKDSFEMPFVTKPVSDGSSVGVFIVKNDKDLDNIFYDDENIELLVEQYIDGLELTVAVIDGKALAVTELKPKLDFYDYKSKYTAGATEHILPANIDKNVYDKCLADALIMHKALGCNMVSRSDFRYNKKDGVVFLETNTNPGMTPLSLVPEQAKFVGISYEELCVKLVESAQCKKI